MAAAKSAAWSWWAWSQSRICRGGARWPGRKCAGSGEFVGGGVGQAEQDGVEQGLLDAAGAHERGCCGRSAVWLSRVQACYQAASGGGNDQAAAARVGVMRIGSS